jgi:hypothetical protein
MLSQRVGEVMVVITYYQREESSDILRLKIHEFKNTSEYNKIIETFNNFIMQIDSVRGGAFIRIWPDHWPQLIEHLVK